MSTTRQPAPAITPGTFAPGHANALAALSRTRTTALATANVATLTTPPAFRPVNTGGLNWDAALNELRKAGAL